MILFQIPPNPKQRQEKKTRVTYRLCLPSGLDDGRPPTIFVHGLHVVPEPDGEARERQEPEDDAEGAGHAQL